MTSPISDPTLADLDARTAALAARAAATLAGVPEPALLRAPESGGWSMGQVLEHVMVADADYMALMSTALDSPAARTPSARPWKPTWIARLLLWAIRPGNSMKAKTTPRYDNLTPRAGVTNAYLAHLEVLRTLIRRADGADLNGPRIRSPISSLVKLSLGDAFQVLVTHAERHQLQLERTRAEIVA